MDISGVDPFYDRQLNRAGGLESESESDSDTDLGIDFDNGFGRFVPQQDTPPSSRSALEDYQAQLMLLEQQNKERLRLARQAPDAMHDTQEPLHEGAKVVIAAKSFDSSEKTDQDVLPLPVVQAQETKTSMSRRVLTAFLVVSAVIWTFSSNTHHILPQAAQTFDRAPQCVQVDPILPSSGTKLKEMEVFVSSPTFRNQSITRLSNAVKIPSISYDDMGAIGKDRRWDIFYVFESYLNTTFPLLHSKLRKEIINTHGLIYTWEGTDADLKPTLLMAHQDVVPVADSTIDSWTHPPFSGHYDGHSVWGRGSSDCKNQLIAIMESVELLLTADYKPKRTVILSFGFDEEVSGPEGAGHLAPFLVKRYGKDSVAAIVDEGAGFTSAWGATYAAPAVAEKGYTDVTITVRMPGGHSSIPPSHTSIGVLSRLITLIEERQYLPRLDSRNPYLGQLHCGAEHSPEFPPKLRKLLSKHHAVDTTCKKRKDPLAEEVARESLDIRYLMQTSQAVDIMVGGVKVNALPERVSAVVNHRINIGERPRDAQARITTLAKQIAKDYGLGLHAFDDVEAANSIMLSASNTTLEPAPVTPTTIYLDDDNTVLSPYGILSGTTRALYGSKINMAPGLSTGNTDTRYYWDLSKHIFRYGPGYEEGQTGLGNIHTVDEKQSVIAHVNAVKWFGMFIRNMDEAKMP